VRSARGGVGRGTAALLLVSGRRRPDTSKGRGGLELSAGRSRPARRGGHRAVPVLDQPALSALGGYGRVDATDLR
jgi:hypothetical protein